MHRTEPSRLQALCLQLSEKVATLVDNNERIFEMKQGNFFGFQKQNYQQQGQFGQTQQQQNQGWGQNKFQRGDQAREGGGWNRSFNRQNAGKSGGGGGNQWQGRRGQRSTRAY